MTRRLLVRDAIRVTTCMRMDRAKTRWEKSLVIAFALIAYAFGWVRTVSLKQLTCLTVIEKL